MTGVTSAISVSGHERKGILMASLDDAGRAVLDAGSKGMSLEYLRGYAAGVEEYAATHGLMYLDDLTNTKRAVSLLRQYISEREAAEAQAE